MFSNKDQIEFRKKLSAKYWSAGVLMRDDLGKFLLVKDKHGKWNTPGGLGDEGESMLETLKREVREEIGCEIENARIILLDEHIGRIDEYVDQSLQSVWMAELVAGSEVEPDGEEIVDYGFFEWEEFLEKVDPVIEKRLKNVDIESLGFVYLVNGEKI